MHTDQCWDRLQLSGSGEFGLEFAVNASRPSYKDIRTAPISFANAVQYVPTVLR